MASAILPAASAWAALGASVTLFTGDLTDIYPGETTRLQITLSNSNTGSAVNNVAFSNSLPGVLPNGLTIAGVPSYTCTDPSGPSTAAGAGTLTAVVGTQNLALSNGVIPARASNTDGTCTIIVPITAGTSSGSSATYTYTIASGAVTGNDGGAIANSGTVNQSINVRVMAQPSLSKSFGSSTLVLGGATTTLTVTLTNTNPVAISNFNITDSFPQLGGSAIIRVAPTPGATASCNNSGSAPVFAPLAGATSISATGTIPAKSGATNGTCTLTVQVEGAQTNSLYSTGAQTNSINAISQFTNDLGLAAAANATANVTVRSPLRVTKAFAHSSLSSGQSDSLTITLHNDSNNPLAITSLTDDPIDGTSPGNSNAFGLKVTGQSTTCAGGLVGATANGTGVALTGGTIPAGGSCAVTVNFTGISQTAGVPITYTNTVVQGAVNVGNPAIVSQVASASILVADDLRVLKSATPAQAAPGNPVQFSVTVQNYSASAINNVVVTDHLSNGLTFLTGTINGHIYTPSLSGTGCVGLSVSGATASAVPTFTIATLPARADVNNPGACVVTFWAMTSTGAANGSSTANTLSAGDVCYNNGATCNGGSSNTSGGTVTTTVLSASKSFNPTGPVSEGTISTLTVAFSNWSANALTNASVADTLPTDVGGGQLRIATPANAASNCGSPTITAAPGSTSLSMNGGTIPARAGNGTGAVGTCFIKVDVIGPAGTYLNTATVGGTDTYADGTTHLVGPLPTNTATLTYTSSLSATKSFNPASVSSGGRSTVTVRLNNAGAVALSSVAVTDPLPAGMVIAPTPNAYTTCSGGTSISVAAGAATASLSGVDIAGGGSCDFLFDVIATGSANWVNTIPPGNINANGGVRNVVAVTGTLTYNAPTNMTVAKATNPSTLTFPGQVSQLTITINNGNQSVTGLRLNDHFSVDGTAGASANGMVIAATPAVSTTCPGGIVTAAPGGNSVSLSGASMASSASCTVTANVTSNAVGGITNYIPAGSIVSDQGLSNAGQATTSLTTQSNIGVVKQFTPNVVQPGQRSRLRITFYNPTNTPLSNLAVIDTMPTGVTVPSGANPSTNCAGATVTSPATSQVQISGGTVAAASGGVAASCYAEIDVLVAAQGDFVNTIPAGTVTANSGGSSATNSQPTSDTLRAKSPLTVHKAIAGNTLDIGNPVGFATGSASRGPGAAATLTVRLDNPNAVALTGAGFSDNLPSGLVVAATPNVSTTCVGGAVIAAASATSIRLAGGTIPAGGSCTVSVDVLSNISGTYTNTIAAGGVITFEGVTNAEPTQAALIVSTPPTVSKQFSPAVIPSNGTSTLTLFLGNANTAAVTLTSALVDTLPTAPDPIVVAAVPNVNKTCPGAVTANAGSGSITYANGGQIPAGGCTVSVDVTAAVPGNHINNIPAGALQTSGGNNQQAANATLTISTLGYVSGKVFRDNKVIPNGIFQSATDTAIVGTSIELHGGASCSGALVAIGGLTNPASTDALGNYLFAGLPAGTYSVCEPVQPSGTVNGSTTAGVIVSSNGSTGTSGTASNPTATTSQITGIVLRGNGGSGEISGSLSNNFAEVVQSSISGAVFLDQNDNGVRNGNDNGIVGVAVELRDGSNVLVATTATDASGNYIFSGLNPGTYTLREPSQPTGTSNGITTAGTVPNGGTSGTATAVNTLPSSISGIVLPPNTMSLGNNFAEIPNGRTVSGTVFLDYNNNGVLNSPPDHGVGGVVVALTGNDVNGNAVNLTATTAADGTYTFAGVPSGNGYILTTQGNPPSGTTMGIVTPGSTGGVATHPTVATGRISAIPLAATSATVSANNNFALVPGNAPDLTITKTHAPASFGAGSTTGIYTITPSNIGLASTSGAITITDAVPVGMTATAASGNGWVCVISGQTVTCTTNQVLAAGATGNAIQLHVSVGAAQTGQVLTNVAVISGGGEPTAFAGNNTASDPTPIAASATVQGTVWRDLNHDRVLDTSDPLLAGWIVELLLNGNIVASATTNTNGAYSITGIAPGSGYTIRFRNPVSGAIFGSAVPNETGAAYSSGVVGIGNPGGANTQGGMLANMTLLAGTTTVQQSLPVDPGGVVYDAVTRNPIAGAAVTISGPAGFSAGNLVGGSASTTTDSSGYYQFLLLNTAPAGTYVLHVTAPAGYLPTPSSMIPPCAATLTVGALPNPAIIQSGAAAPAISVPNEPPASCPGSSAGISATSGTTQYYYSFVFNPAANSANVVNNNIPVDPVLGGAIVVTKTTPMLTTSTGGLVPYTITATNTLAAPLTNIDVRDQIPPGFKYRVSSATLNGAHLEPTVSGLNLTWKNQSFAAGEKKTYKLVLMAGSGVSEGEYVNRAWALNDVVGSTVSNIASATVRIVPDPTFDCSDLIGKVFDDRNANGYQDEGEPGIPNVRVVTVHGLLVTTDADGRFHVACADIPQADHGSNFIMKLDERTLPSGYRMTTENPRVVRMTAGKMVKLNFGATIHKVFRIELDGRAFAESGDNLLAAWQEKLARLIPDLGKRPSVLRIAYHLQPGEPSDRGQERAEAVSHTARSLYEDMRSGHGEGERVQPPLVIETESVPTSMEGAR